MLEKPQEIVIEVTSQCNFNCYQCFNKASFAKNGRHQELMSTDYIKRIINNMVENGIKNIRFTGGEPLLRKDIFILIDYAKSQNLNVRLNTNASLITKQVAKKLADKIDDVLISFHGYDDQTDLKWTNTSQGFKNKLRGIFALKQVGFPSIRIGTALTKANIKNLEKIYQYFELFQFSRWELWRPISLVKAKEEIDFKSLLGKLEKIYQKYPSQVTISNCMPFCAYETEKLNKYCIGAISDDGHRRIIVDPSGFAKPSYFIHKNIGSPLDLKKCWEDKFMQKLRNLDLVPHECKKCEHLLRCKGGSRYLAKLHFGEYCAKDPLMP